MTTIARVKVWVPGDVLTSSDLNGEFNNIINVANGQLDSNNINTAAAFTWTNNHTFGTDKKLYFRDTTNYIYSSATGKLDQYCNGYRAGSKYNTGSGALYCYYDTSTTTGEIRQFFANSDLSKYFEQDYGFTSGDVAWLLQSNSKSHLAVSDTNSYFKPLLDVSMVATRKFYWDGAATTAALSGNTYTQESSADVLDTYVGGALTQRLSATGMQLVDTDPPSANYFVRKSAVSGKSNFTVTGTSTVTANEDFNVSSTTCLNWDVTVNWDTDFSTTYYSCVCSVSSAVTTTVEVNTSTGSASFVASDSTTGAQLTAGWSGNVIASGTQA